MQPALTLTEKILALHRIDSEQSATRALRPGETLRVKVDFTLASELAWNGMQRTYERLGRPALFDRERFYLAVDHSVDPETLARDGKTQRLVQLARQLRDEQRLPHFYDANETILHTTFYRDYVQPGQLILGADSHTTSHGALGAFAIGLGGADVVAAMVSGETWLQVPECLEVVYSGSPRFGILGKDIVLATLAELGRNTLALERSVEFRGETRQLSLDTRFAICNMTAELGGLCGLFEPDAAVQAWLEARPRARREAVFLAADPGAHYAARAQLRLDRLRPRLARPSSPDRGAEVAEEAGLRLDGCFIGACTTTEEELVLAGLLLERALAAGLTPDPVEAGKRLMVPGNREIEQKLRDSGLLAIYERAGFVIDPPGCSMCLGVASRRARPDEVWLSSQNRNFPNRMGPGSHAYLASACTVAASAFDLRLRDPSALMEEIDRERFSRILQGSPAAALTHLSTTSNEARPTPTVPPGHASVGEPSRQNERQRSETALPPDSELPLVAPPIRGRVQRFGDGVDTDAMIPGEFCHLQQARELGDHCFQYFRPEFVAAARNGRNIVVAGSGWGSGSSREQAVWALQGAGVQLIVARSIAFIHKRNLVNEALPFLELDDPEFYALAEDDRELSVDFASGKILDVASGRVFQARAPRGAARRLFATGGLIPALELERAQRVGGGNPATERLPQSSR